MAAGDVQKQILNKKRAHIRKGEQKMLSDFEREMCRNRKRMLDAQQTFQGQMAIKLAKAQYKEQEERERILKIYSGQVELPVGPNQPKAINPILQRYMNN